MLSLCCNFPSFLPSFLLFFFFSSFSRPSSLRPSQSSLCSFLFANILLQTILCVWQRKQFHCLGTPGGIWCLWCCLGQASPRKVNYLWLVLQGTRMATSHLRSSVTKWIRSYPGVPLLPTMVYQCCDVNYWDPLPGIEIYRVQVKNKRNRRHFLPTTLWKRCFLEQHPSLIKGSVHLSQEPALEPSM